MKHDHYGSQKNVVREQKTNKLIQIGSITNETWTEHFTKL